MKIRCLGGFREVGRNAVLIESKEKILFDYGVRVETNEIPKPVENVDNIILGHAHLDHCGCLPMLYRKFKVPVFSTIATFEQAHLLLKDSLKVGKIKGFAKHFGESDIEKMKRSEVRITYGQRIDAENFSLDIFDAGHIPGSICPLMEMDKKRILYVSDFNLNPTRLLNGARIDAKDVDILILESTYSNRNHPNRKETEKKFFEAIESTIANEGIAVIPSFAVARAAEVLMILDSFKPNFPVYLDGMAKEATQIALKYPEFIRDYKALKKALEDVKLIYSNDERRKIIKEPCAIVTSSGELEGGPSVMYIKYLYNNPESSIIFTGFLIPRTAARYLVDTGRFVTEGFDLKIKMGIYTFNFSAHSDRNNLFDFVNKIKPEKIICLHGDYCERFAQELRGRGFDAIAPKNGDIIEID
ncbi:MAG: MBL fold metallo-hydrolase [Candidatus Aenigmatarchaeota archaeon]